ncbi:retrovirus-related Pol polyprotein from type-1 retrotransposable element R2 [Elysia marginata]|uniref:Retrovirus-related Pol polyprotein from type-1 retrotransposable element R2 n=1 Tax=Elysia marginata TaxID=1093978 RepID=A0AAV4IQG9_9GAST|nr:retrovirus-related Pol polyprotein from type-1 retrotransposable element R2 [Elysia marginata]
MCDPGLGSISAVPQVLVASVVVVLVVVVIVVVVVVVVIVAVVVVRIIVVVLSVVAVAVVVVFVVVVVVVFDCVSHNKMIETLKKYNCHFKIINLIKNLYQNQVAAVRMENGNTEWFQVKGGVRQGCILSPALFSLYTESIMRDVEAEDTEDKYSAIKLNGNPITELRYADDTALSPRPRRD